MKRFEYKKVIGFTLQQKRAFEVLEEHGVNVNKFIRQAIAEKIKSDWRKSELPTHARGDGLGFLLHGFN